MGRTRTAVGFKVRIGRAVVVALRGPATAPEVVAKSEIQVAFTFEEGAVYHAAEELGAERAASEIRKAEATFTKRARAEIAKFLAQLDAAPSAAGFGAKAVGEMPPLESILRSHPLVHTAEIELYRRVYAEACAAVGPRPERFLAGTMAKSIAKALGWTPAKVSKHLTAMGKASGRPWAAHQKDAALAAWLALI